MDGKAASSQPTEAIGISTDALPFAGPGLHKFTDLKALQAQLAATEAALQRERDRADLLASELARLRASVSSGVSSPAGLPSSPVSPAPPPFPGSPSAADAVSDMVLVPRAHLEMLHLKERAMDAVQEGITIADAQAPDMPLVYVNAGFARLTGYPSETFSMGKNCRFLQGPCTEPEVVAELSAAIKAGQPCVVQITNYKRNGNPFLNYLSLTPVHDAAGTLTHYVGVQADITELVVRRQAELAAKHAAVEAAAATEAKSQFLARMSHEIRTPLNGMIAVGQLLADTKLTPAQWDLVNTIRCSGEALLTLITDILDFSKIEANKMVLSSSPFALEATIEAAMEIAGLHAARKRLQVAYHVASGVPRVIIGDAQRLQQVLLNILNNALKFTDAGEVMLEVWTQPVSRPASRRSSVDVGRGNSGPPSRRTSFGSHPSFEARPPSGRHSFDARSPGRASQDFIRSAGTSPSPVTGANALVAAVSAAASDAASIASDASDEDCVEIHFSVRDTGIGIGAQDLARLFQSFSQVDASPTRRFGGSGLGLAISQKLSEAMGGRMWAESAGLGRGSTFRWCIQTRRAGAETVATAAAGRGGAWGPAAPLAAPSAPLIPQLIGRRVLLVEPCDMVRQVMLLALRQWGAAVCAVESERAAVAKLALLPGQAPTTPVPVTPSAAKSRLTLSHAGGEGLREALAASAACTGPFDIVVMDVGHTSLLRALLESCEPGEAKRVVFLGWPGHNDPEDSGSGGGGGAGAGGGSPSTAGVGGVGGQEAASAAAAAAAAAAAHGSMPAEAAPPAYASGTLDMPAVALPPRMLTEPGTPELPAGVAAAAAAVAAAATAPPAARRHLGYVVVSRPVRQGRLLLGLQEVMEMDVDAATAAAEEREASAKATAVAAGGGGHGSARVSSESGRAGPGSGSSGLPNAPSTAALSDLAAALARVSAAHSDADASSEAAASSSALHRSLGSTSSLLQAAPFKRISSGSSLATAVEGGGFGGAALAALDNSQRRLLLAEDNAINMKVALGILRRLGFTDVVTAPDGVAAVEAVAAAGGPAAFDAILMDLHMPRKGGIEAVQDILRAWPNQRTKIIAVTADAFEDTRDTCVANGFTGWLAKPFRVEEFARVMDAKD